MKNKQLTKAMYVLIITFSICPYLCTAKTTKSPRSTPGTAIFVMAHQPLSLTLESKQLKYEDSDIKLNMKVPQILEEKNDTFRKEFNKETLRIAKEHKQEMISMAKNYNKDLKRDGLSPVVFEYLEDFSVIETLEPYYTLALFKYQYNGGAHGISQVDYLTLDLTNRQIMTLGNFFNKKLDYQHILDTIIKEQITARSINQNEFFYPVNGACLIKNSQPFFFDVKGNLNIVFNAYEIAPYSSGILYFTIPHEQILPYMK